MSQNDPKRRRLEALSRMSVEDILLFKFIDDLSDEEFAARYAAAHGLNCKSPDYRRIDTEE